MPKKEYATITHRTLFIYVLAQTADCLASFKASTYSIKIEVLATLDDTSYHPISRICDNYAQNAIYIHFGTKNEKYI